MTLDFGFRQIGINNVLDLWASFILDDHGAPQFAGHGLLIRDNYNLLATNSRPLADGLTYAELMELIKPFDPFLLGDGFRCRGPHPLTCCNMR